MVSKGFSNVVTSGQLYNIGEKPTVILYNINHHVGTPKQKAYLLYSIFGLRVPDYGTVIMWFREIKLKIRFGVVISKEIYES